MEWSKFIITVVVLYVAYYLINILYDMLRTGKSSNKDEVIPLTFEDDTEVKSIDDVYVSPSNEEKRVEKAIEPLPEKGVINQELQTNNERKEEYYSPTDEVIKVDEENQIKPTGSIQVLSDTFISGGLDYDELLQEAQKGSLLKSALVDFGEEV